MGWHIKVDGSGVAVGHVDLPADANPLTEAKGDKVWFKPATMIKPTPGVGQVLTGPVYDIMAATITYTATDTAESQRANVVAGYAETLLSGGVILSAATVSSGTRFKCDDQSVNRLHAFCVKADRLEAAAQSVDITFRTQGGVAITLTSAAEAWAIYDEITTYAGAVLEASATAQSAPPLDPATVSWPSDGS